MINFICTDSYNDYLRDGFFKKVEDMMSEALVEADFGAEDVEVRFSDSKLLSLAIRCFNMMAKDMGYVTQIVRETEIYVFGIDGNKTRFTFLNSIPEGTT